MKVCSFIIKSLFMAFFIINAINVLQNVIKHSRHFQAGFELTVKILKSKFGLDIGRFIKVQSVLLHSESIVKYTSIAQLVLSLACIFIHTGFGVGAIYIYTKISFINGKMIQVASSSLLPLIEKYLMLISLLCVILMMLCIEKCSKKIKNSSQHSRRYCPNQ